MPWHCQLLVKELLQVATLEHTRRILVTLTHTLSNTLPDTHKPHKVLLLAVLTGNGDNYLHRNHSGILALPGRQRHHLQNQ